MGVDGEQDAHAVPGAGSDFRGRGAGGQPQRQRGMTQVVGAQARGARQARSAAGLVSDPAVSAFAERPAAGTPEQPPIGGAPVGVQVMAQKPDELRGGRDCPAGAVGVMFEARGARVACRSWSRPALTGQGSGEGQLSPAACREGPGRARRATASAGRSAALFRQSKNAVSSGRILVTSARTVCTSAGVAADSGPAGQDDLGASM
jgi:hypothetical protein